MRRPDGTSAGRSIHLPDRPGDRCLVRIEAVAGRQSPVLRIKGSVTYWLPGRKAGPSRLPPTSRARSGGLSLCRAGQADSAEPGPSDSALVGIRGTEPHQPEPEELVLVE